MNNDCPLSGIIVPSLNRPFSSAVFEKNLLNCSVLLQIDVRSIALESVRSREVDGSFSFRLHNLNEDSSIEWTALNEKVEIFVKAQAFSCALCLMHMSTLERALRIFFVL